MYENAFNSIEKDLRAEEGIANELDYVEQTSWVLFLKYLDDLENERWDRAELDGRNYRAKFDHNSARIGNSQPRFDEEERQALCGEKGALGFIRTIEVGRDLVLPRPEI